MQATLVNWAFGATIKTALAVVPRYCSRDPEGARFEVPVRCQAPTPRRGRPVLGA